MEYICQFFEPIDVVKIYLASGEEIYKKIAEDACETPIIVFKEFIKEEVNVFIWEDLHILHCFGYVYVCDDTQNYIKMKNNAYIDTVYVNNIESFNKMWKSLHLIFAELFVKDMKLTKPKKTYYKMSNSAWIRIPFDGFGVYNSNREFKTLGCF